MYRILSFLLIFHQIIAQELSNDAQIEIPGAQFCTCDLTVNACDVNCCCDAECGEVEKRLFTHCRNEVRPQDTHLCVQPGEILLNNSQYKARTSRDGLLCIERDNYQERYAYIEPEPIEDVEGFEKLKMSYTSDIKSSLFKPQQLKIAETYRIGDPILSVFEDRAISYLTLPYPLLSGFCGSTSAVEMFRNSAHSCKVVLKNLGTDCTRQAELSAKFYTNGIRVLKSPHLLNTTLSETALNDAIQNLKFAGALLSINTTILTPQPKDVQVVPEPLWDQQEQICSNVVSQVKYLFSINSTAGIVSAQAHITLISIKSQAATIIWPLNFATEFRWEFEKEPSRVLSGNPGYKLGAPVLAGTLVESYNGQAVLVNPDRTQWLTVIASDNCQKYEQRAPIRFGYNMQSGCLIDIGMDTSDQKCKEIQEIVLRAMQGPLRNQVAAYANASSENVGDWVNILVENPPVNEARSPGPGSCTLVKQLHIEILFASAGSANDPQSKIVGVMYRYDAAADVSLQCVFPYCTEQGETLRQKFAVITTVQFVDVTTKAKPKFAVIPTLDVKLPHDFFYPFTGSAVTVSCSVLTLLSCFVFIVHILFVYVE